MELPAASDFLFSLAFSVRNCSRDTRSFRLKLIEGKLGSFLFFSNCYWLGSEFLVILGMNISGEIILLALEEEELWICP